MTCDATSEYIPILLPVPDHVREKLVGPFSVHKYIHSSSLRNVRGLVDATTMQGGENTSVLEARIQAPPPHPYNDLGRSQADDRQIHMTLLYSTSSVHYISVVYIECLHDRI